MAWHGIWHGMAGLAGCLRACMSEPRDPGAISTHLSHNIGMGGASTYHAHALLHNTAPAPGALPLSIACTSRSAVDGKQRLSPSCFSPFEAQARRSAPTLSRCCRPPRLSRRCRRAPLSPTVFRRTFSSTNMAAASACS